MSLELLAKAEQGDAKSQFMLGMMLENAMGVSQDYTAAFNWYKKAAAQGLSEAHHNIGVMYYNGSGVATDFVAAAQWFRLAAKKGHIQAQIMFDLIIMKHLCDAELAEQNPSDYS